VKKLKILHLPAQGPGTDQARAQARE
jgi:hypothetical protein